MLNNDHFQPDLANDFDESITLPAASHAAFTRAARALRPEQDGLLSHVTNAPRIAMLSMAQGLSTNTDCRIGCGKPDKPGTVRAPGSRFVPKMGATPKRWSGR